MNCKEVRDLLAFSLDEPLGTADQAAVDSHLGHCPACVRWLTEQVLTVQVLRGVAKIEEKEVPPPLSSRLIARILAARRAEIAQRGRGKKSG